jgi:hypothetical protein
MTMRFAGRSLFAANSTRGTADRSFAAKTIPVLR